MKNMYVILLVIVAIFATWFVTKQMYINRTIEFFTTNFQPSDNLEDAIKGYKYAFGDKRSDLDTYFGFPDNIMTGFSHRILPIMK